MPAGSAATRSKAPASESPARGRTTSAADSKTTPTRPTSGKAGGASAGAKAKSPSPSKKTPAGKTTGGATPKTGGKTPKTPAGRTPGTAKKGTSGKKKKAGSPKGGELVHNLSFGQNEMGVDGVVQLYGSIAAEGVDPKAMFTMGWMYNFGLGDATKDCRKAVAYYTKAAEMDYEMANYQLGLLQWRGEGTKKNALKALENFTLSADRGNSLALLQLARCYEKGSGEELAVDKEKSKEYYQKAVALGCETSKKKLESN